MNNKKLLAALVALTMSATTAVAFSGCDTNKHTHNYTDWTITTPPTCTKPGVETGTCPDDGAMQDRPVDPLGHDYGDWVITEAPTETSEGKATKICANDSAHDHVIEVTLPNITITNQYTIKQLAETPTYVRSQYTFEHEEGDIVFEANVTKTGVTQVDLSVEDAVTTAIDPYYSSLVGSGEGELVTKTTREYASKISYEFGENYTHVKNGNAEYWLEIDGEEVSGIVSDGYTYRWANENDVDYMSGVTFNNPFSNETCFGPEELLESLYYSATSTADYNNAFYSEKANQHNGVYYFEWTVVETSYNQYSKMNTDIIYKAFVEFALDNNFMLSTLNLSYDKYSYQYEAEETEEGSGIYVATGELPYIYDKNENTYEPNPEDEPLAHYEINVEQIGYREILPINPWELDELVITSFNMLAGGEATEEEYNQFKDDPNYVVESSVITWSGEKYYVVKKHFEAGETINITTADNIYVYLIDFAPESAAEYASLNPVRVYLVDDDGEETLIAASDSWPWGTPVTASYSSYDSSILFKSRENTGDFTIKICIGEASKTFTLHVDAAAPEELVTNVNIYNDAKDSYDVKKTNNVTVYEGQDLTFEVAVGKFAEDQYTCNPDSTVTLKEDYEGVTLTENNGVYTLKAPKAGEYVINVVSKLDESVTATLTVTVEEAPDVENDILTGEYKAGDFTVSFNGGKAAVSDGENKVAEFDCTYVDGVLSATSSDNKFSIELTENFNLVLVYVDDFNVTNRAVLKVPGDAGEAVIEALEGTWSGTFDYYYGVVFVFNADGTATVNVNNGGDDQLTYELSDNGDGTFALSFVLPQSFNGWYCVKEEGAIVTFDGTNITNLSLIMFDVDYGDEFTCVATKN